MFQLNTSGEHILEILGIKDCTSEVKKWVEKIFSTWDVQNGKKEVKQKLSDLLEVNDNLELALYLLDSVWPKAIKKFTPRVKEDISVAKKIVSMDLSNLSQVPEKVKNQKEFILHYTRELAQHSLPQDSLISFLNSLDKKIVSEELKKICLALFNQENIYRVKISKNINSIKNEESILFQKLLSKWFIISKSADNYTINDKFIELFIRKNPLILDEKWFSKKNILALIINEFWIQEFAKNKQFISLFDEFFSLLISEGKKDKKTKLKSNNQQQEEKKSPSVWVSDNSSTLPVKSSFEEWEYINYSCFWACMLAYPTPEGAIKSIDDRMILSKSEIEWMSQEAVKNYISFYAILDKSWLSFLLSRYRNDFFRILNNNDINIDYKIWNGISESNMISAFNLLAKKMRLFKDMLEEDNINPQWNYITTSNSSKWFSSVEWGLWYFRGCNDSGIIWWIIFPAWWFFSGDSIMLQYMKEIWLASSTWWLEDSKW